MNYWAIPLFPVSASPLRGTVAVCQAVGSVSTAAETPQNGCAGEAGVNNNQRSHMDDQSVLSGQDETRRSSSGCLGRGGNAGQGEESQPGAITAKLITGALIMLHSPALTGLHHNRHLRPAAGRKEGSSQPPGGLQIPSNK